MHELIGLNILGWIYTHPCLTMSLTWNWFKWDVCYETKNYRLRYNFIGLIKYIKNFLPIEACSYEFHDIGACMRIMISRDFRVNLMYELLILHRIVVAEI